MKKFLKLYDPVTATTVEGVLTTAHSASSYGQPVLVLSGGELVDPSEWPLYDVLAVTEAEEEEA